MSSTRAAIRYAKAILEIATSKNAENEVCTDMKQIASTIHSNAELNTFIQNPTIRVDAKQNALLAVFAQAHDVTKSLFRLLFENKRFEILEAITLEYQKRFDAAQGIQLAQVTTAIPMDSATEALVREKIATLSDKKINIENKINPDLIGGFILTIGDQQYNASVANRLQVLKRELSN